MDVREILHWLVDAVSRPSYEHSAATPDDVHQAIDDAHGYTPPKAAFSPEEEAQYNALVAKQRAFDEQNAAAKAEVDHVASGL